MLICVTSGEFCSDLKCSLFLIDDGKCDPQCLSKGCKFDEGDCCDVSVCSIGKRGNGVCDSECDSVGCGFDFGDCIYREEEIVVSSMNILILLSGCLLMILLLAIFCLVECYRKYNQSDHSISKPTKSTQIEEKKQRSL